jgi:hypothetical protein
MFVVEQTHPHTSQAGGVPEKGRIVLHLPQDKFTVIDYKLCCIGERYRDMSRWSTYGVGLCPW